MLTKCSDKGGKCPAALLQNYKSVPQRRIAAWAFCLMILLSSSLWAQSSKEYIYLNGKVVASTSTELIPRCFLYSGTNGTQGFAGIDTVTMTVCNGANMRVTLHYTKTPWPSGDSYSDDNILDPLDANGQLSFFLPQDIAPGLTEVQSS
jgi:hypothetical protein